MTKTISFDTDVTSINSIVLLVVPREESAKLPSRGQVMVRGTINDVAFETPLEPDGKGSHWLKLDDTLRNTIKLGASVHVEMESSKEWPEPAIPQDLQTALDTHQDILPLWKTITPMARWDWLRWINATNVEATRKHRIDVAIDKLRKGTRRPCCFNRTACTDPDVSKSGVLLAS